MAKAHVYKRDHVNTDEIIPARYLNTDDTAELAKHCMEDLDTDFVKKVQARRCDRLRRRLRLRVKRANTPSGRFRAPRSAR